MEAAVNWYEERNRGVDLSSRKNKETVVEKERVAYLVCRLKVLRQNMGINGWSLLYRLFS